MMNICDRISGCRRSIGTLMLFRGRVEVEGKRYGRHVSAIVRLQGASQHHMYIDDCRSSINIDVLLKFHHRKACDLGLFGLSNTLYILGKSNCYTNGDGLLSNSNSGAIIRFAVIPRPRIHSLTSSMSIEVVVPASSTDSKFGNRIWLTEGRDRTVPRPDSTSRVVQ